MTDTINSSDHRRIRNRIAAGVALWFGVAFTVAATGNFHVPAGEPPLPLVIAALTPVAVFFILYAQVPAFRAFVLGLDLRTLVIVQSWRVIGSVFLALYAYDVLPGLFAWPAGLGDVAVGISAPFVAAALIARPAFAGERAFVIWNGLGILDFFVAFFTGALASGVIPGLVEVTSEPVGVLPLAVIPGFLVPLFAILHLAAVLQGRRLARAQAEPLAAAA